MAKTTREDLMNAAERRVRDAGYNGFSFRDLAEDVGITSASVHHHFPTKQALVGALAERYTERFLQGLSGTTPGAERIAAYRAAFRASVAEDGLMCLCGMLGAESGGLPDEVLAQTRMFFDRTSRHLAEGLAGPDPAARARQILARLEGAIILARTMGEIAYFDEAAADLA
ncbi:MAG: TetR/AcrR family transcriptional regulator [Pseudomonadota bacterium]